MKLTICHYCGKPIEKRDQLVTASNWLRVRPYHYVCFDEVEKESSTIYNSWTPLNGPAGNITAVIMAVLSGWLLLTDTWGLAGSLIGFVALYRVLIRFAALIGFERKVPE
ncbi:hypothetical protein ERJ70_03955 [Sediminibacillus dalangtanensis]|uniref:Uncharacterized protein n=1 Tax=Sediminibacillus dalangtanensis TaxID=2729421 RepID=A0ABX7VNS3_9BACI|nr:hypothetical protein [Sediminibacillus dalangtanensis]QTM98524.1 hypothetical protein ERJ70_03955 [Sediminibacillus dalangtanensis]